MDFRRPFDTHHMQVRGPLCSEGQQGEVALNSSCGGTVTWSESGRVLAPGVIVGERRVGSSVSIVGLLFQERDVNPLST